MKLINKLLNKKITVGVMGLGYVGLPIVKSLCNKNIKVIGFDTDEKKIDYLNQFKSYILSIKNKDIKKFIEKKIFKPTNDFSKINIVDVIIICVPTPLKNNFLPDLKFVEKSVNLIKQNRKFEQLIILESTTYPETTIKKIINKLNNKKFVLGQNYYVGYSPEREDPGNKKFNNVNIPKIISAEDEKSLINVEKFYKLYIKKIVKVSNTKTAETVKLFENIFRAVNIALVNELKIILGKMNIDMWDVIEAAKTKPFGFMPFYPGPGFGGHCIPVDPFYLTWKAKQIGQNTEFIKLAGMINRKMPDYIYKSINNFFKNKKKSYNKILIVGLSYKKNVPDLRESPALYVLKKFSNKKVNCDFYDPFFKNIPKNSIFNSEKKSISLSKMKDNYYDAVIVITDHNGVNYNLIYKKTRYIFDTRNVYKNKNKSKIIKL